MTFEGYLKIYKSWALPFGPNSSEVSLNFLLDLIKNSALFIKFKR